MHVYARIHELYVRSSVMYSTGERKRYVALMGGLLEKNGCFVFTRKTMYVSGGAFTAKARQCSKQFEGSSLSSGRDPNHDPNPHRLRRVSRYRHIEGTLILSSFSR